MASNGTALEYDFVEKPSKDYFCPVTFEILTDPQQTSSCCGHHLSRAAADRLKQEGDACPLCNDWPLKTTDDPFFRRQVMALKVRCSNKALGCEWVGGLGELEEHMKVGSWEGKCEYANATCPYECGDQVQRRSLRVHKSDKCVKRPFTCQYCSHKATYEEVTRDHWPQCQKYPLKCPNKCCEEDIERRFLKCHLNLDCPLQEIECKFSYAGCGAKMQRRMMQEHMDKSKDEHIDALATHGKTTNNQLRVLSLALTKIAPQPIFIPLPEIVLEKFEQRKEDNEEWFSPPFHTHIGGYKMCLSINASGWGDGEGTHVSVFVYMMRGEFGDHLQWPFKGVIKVQLINQRQGGDHVERVIVSEDDECDDILCPVLEGDKGEEGWGFCEFTSHTNLYKPEEGKEYLKNDTLRFIVNVVTVKSI